VGIELGLERMELLGAVVGGSTDGLDVRGEAAWKGLGRTLCEGSTA